MMKVVLLARTIGPSKSLARVATRLIDRGHQVLSLLSKDPGVTILPEYLFEFDPDVVCMATSSMNIEDEAGLAQQAIELGVPYTVFADTFGAFNRPGFPADLREAAAAVFVPNEPEARFAKEVGYANPVVTGVPLWEEFAALSAYPARIKTREALGIHNNEAAVISAFGKDGVLNKKLLGETLEALDRAAKESGIEFAFVPRFHPGDQSLKSDPDFYQGVLAASPVRAIDSSAYKSADDLVPAIDIVVSQFSTIGITAIYQRKAVIEFMPEAVLDRLEKQTGRRTWPTVETGAAAVATNVKELTRELGLPEQSAHFAAQAKHFPVERGQAADVIAARLEKIAETRTHASA